MESIREWRIHIGAHKTATTHLQDTLAARRDALVAAGVDFIPREMFRPLRIPATQGRFGWRRRILDGRLLSSRARSLIAHLRRGPGVVAISEEDLPGFSTGLLTGVLYPGAEARLAWLRHLADGGEHLHLFLSVRSFDAVLPSAYAQVLRTRNLPGGFAPIAAAALDRPPSWTAFVERVRRLLPRAALTVWTFEDYVRRDEAIMAKFMGVPLPAGPMLPPSARTRTPSAAAIARIEALGVVEAVQHALAAERILADDALDDGEKYAPFTTKERCVLASAYEEDLYRLRSRFPEMLHESDGGGLKPSL